jgi:hypothetical protein
VPGADDKCKQQAEAAGLGGTWRALVSSGSSPDIDAKDRIPAGTKVIVNMLGQTVAEDQGCGWSSKYGLLWGTSSGTSSSAFCNPIKYDQFGNEVPSSEFVWTGTAATGIVTSSTCSNWSKNSYVGYFGNPKSKAASWIQVRTIKCDEPMHLYCLEQ